MFISPFYLSVYGYKPIVYPGFYPYPFYPYPIFPLRFNYLRWRRRGRGRFFLNWRYSPYRWYL
ncbi:MAG: hypothetical protein DRP55_03875 [Spirochaetes bacterium]|nr:MAG: hypothetical protein DRP55_03875 [Spirochaetota bacterium]